MALDGARAKIHEPGERIDGYTLVERAHTGGMAELWRVTQPDRPAPAMMKIPLLGEDPTSIVGFEVEQMILPMLRGAHVPRWIASGGFETQPYIVMELLQGQSLRARLEELPLAIDEVARIGARIAEALHELHLQHVIHHDIKPSNIMFRPDGRAVLVDFGLARHERLPDLLAEQFRLPLGTGPYISPEQILHNRSDTRSDLFALGVILYYFSTGTRPFGAPTNVRGLRKRLLGPTLPPRALRADVPPWMQEVILHCLEIDPERRYATAAQLAFDLVHPGSIALTARATAQKGRSRWDRWRGMAGQMAARPVARSITQQLGRAPIILAAVDLSEDWEALADALRDAVRQAMQSAPQARLACVSVLRTARIGIETSVDAEGRHRHVQRLVQLQHWARPLALALGRVTFHVLEAPDPATAILDYANNNQVSHILIGSRGSSTLKRYLGSVSTRIVAEARCTVTVVKVARAGAAEEAQVAVVAK